MKTAIFSPPAGYKKRLLRKNSMISVTNITLWLNNYLKLCYKQVATCTALAKANNKINIILKLKKSLKKVYLSFFTLISVLPSLYSTIQFTLSPISASKNFIISFGIVVLADKLFGLATEIFDSYSNTFMPPIFVTYYYIFIYIHIYNNFHKIGRNIYILRRSIYY